MNKHSLGLLFLLLISVSFNAFSQVTIGSTRPPNQWSLLYLDASNQHKALHNARLTTEQRDTLMNTRRVEEQRNLARGLMLFNTDNNCLEFWNGSRWVSLCENNTTDCDPVYYVIHEPYPGIVINISTNGNGNGNRNGNGGTAVDLKVMPVGGTAPFSFQWFNSLTDSETGLRTAIPDATNYFFTTPDDLPVGTHYFYAIISNCNDNYSILSEIFTVNVLSDFSEIPEGSGTLQGRTCFDIGYSNPGDVCGTVQSRQHILRSFVANPTEVYTFSINSPAGYEIENLRFEFENLNDVVVIESITPNIFDNNIAIPGSVQVTVRFNTDLDVLARGLDKNHALRANIHALFNVVGNPQTVRQTIGVRVQDCSCCGAYIAPGVWRQFMCHNLGANESLDPFTPAQGLHGAMYKWGTGIVAISGPDNLTMSPYINGTPIWANRGGMPPTIGSTLIWDMVHANPCPPGFRVPTSAEWVGVIANNQLMSIGSWTAGHANFSSGVMFGDALFLPAAGHRTVANGALVGRGNATWYWSATGEGNNTLTFHRQNANGNPSGRVHLDRNAGLPVRCIRDDE